MIKIFTLLFFFLIAGHSYATEFSSLADCIQQVSQITGKSYFYSHELKGKVHQTDNFELEAKNADTFLSMVLFENGYTRIPLQTGVGYRIIPQKQAKYGALPKFAAGRDKIPENDDFILLSIKLKYAPPYELERSLRYFSSRYGRIVAVPKVDTLLVHDSAKNAKFIYALAKAADLPRWKEKLKK